MRFKTNYPVDFSQRTSAEKTNPFFFERWSPRSFRKVDIPQDILDSIFDAAHWAPSCFNDQPWLIITSSGPEDFNQFLKLLNEANQIWATNASLLGFIFSRKHFSHNGNPNRWATFDCGAAWMSMALQTSLHGLHAHGMAGIDYDQVHGELGVPEEDYHAVCGFALGLIDAPDALPEDFAKREAPSPRRSLNEVWHQGGFKK